MQSSSPYRRVKIVTKLMKISKYDLRFIGFHFSTRLSMDVSMPCLYIFIFLTSSDLVYFLFSKSKEEKNCESFPSLTHFSSPSLSRSPSPSLSISLLFFPFPYLLIFFSSYTLLVLSSTIFLFFFSPHPPFLSHSFPFLSLSFSYSSILCHT